MPAIDWLLLDPGTGLRVYQLATRTHPTAAQVSAGLAAALRESALAPVSANDAQRLAEDHAASYDERIEAGYFSSSTIVASGAATCASGCRIGLWLAIASSATETHLSWVVSRIGGNDSPVSTHSYALAKSAFDQLVASEGGAVTTTDLAYTCQSRTIGAETGR